MLINKQVQRKINFLEDHKLKTYNVGVTCERCAIQGCEVRQMPAIYLEKKAKNKKIENIVEELNTKFMS